MSLDGMDSVFLEKISFCPKNNGFSRLGGGNLGHFFLKHAWPWTQGRRGGLHQLTCVNSKAVKRNTLKDLGKEI